MSSVQRCTIGHTWRFLCNTARVFTHNLSSTVPHHSSHTMTSPVQCFPPRLIWRLRGQCCITCHIYNLWYTDASTVTHDIPCTTRHYSPHMMSSVQCFTTCHAWHLLYNNTSRSRMTFSVHYILHGTAHMTFAIQYHFPHHVWCYFTYWNIGHALLEYYSTVLQG